VSVTNEVTLPADLVAWIEEIAGAPVVHVDRQPGGARKEAWFVDVGDGGGVRELFLRYDRSDPRRTGDPWTLHREASVYRALQDTDVPVAEVLAVHPARQAMLSVRLHGQNWFSRIADAGEQESTAKHFMEKLAALHRIDPHDLDLPHFPPPTSIPDLVRHELDEWDRVIEFRGGEPDPQLAFALGWLRRNIPDVDGPVVLVQGDTGPGNFMYADGKVVAIVDWELAHLGDPMDDIAWLSLRATQEPFTDFPARLREYEELSGHAIDERRVHYYRVMAETKLLVMGHRPADAARYANVEGGGGDVGNGLIYGMLHRRLWFEAIAAFLDFDLTPAEIPPRREPADHDWLYDALLDQLREVVVPRITDPLALQRTKGFARIIKYLRAVSDHRPFYESCELDDIAKLLDSRPTSLTTGRTAVAEAVRAGRVSDLDYLGYAWRRTARENELTRASSGALADRHWPDLR
jgi:aminoglycoside phosphotransferase (APT) family kinase protein